MKTEKLSLKGIKNVLSRAEMKKIMAGSGPCAQLNESCGGTTGKVCCPMLRCNPITSGPDFLSACQS